MKILFFLLLFIATNANAGTIFIRDDGGAFSVECDGSVDAPKNASGRCAVNSFEAAMTVSKNVSDTISMSKGSFIVSVKLDQQNITMNQFISNPKAYTDAVVAGKKVNILNYNGKNFELILK